MFNSDILFIYDAKMCNPNGDPDDENKPRMDYDAQQNLVSDVRLKRYLRDWLQDNGHEIFVTKVEGKVVDATRRLAWALAKRFENEPNKQKVARKLREDLEGNKPVSASGILALEPEEKDILDIFMDVRLFGGTMPIKDPKKGISFTFTGPVQFNWGYSLNKAEIITSSSISSTFAGRTREVEAEEGPEYGTFGKDWRVHYSFMAFHGIVSAKRAEKTNLTEEDIKLLDNALIKAIPQEATTRSKIGQTPRVYLRVEYNNSETFLGDLRSKIDISRKEGLRDISEFELSVGRLLDLLRENKGKVGMIYLWEDKDLRIEGRQTLKALLETDFSGKIVILPHKIEEIAMAA